MNDFKPLGTMYCGWHLDYAGCEKMKIKNDLNLQEMKYCKKKIAWNDLDK